MGSNKKRKTFTVSAIPSRPKDKLLVTLLNIPTTAAAAVTLFTATNAQTYTGGWIQWSVYGGTNATTIAAALLYVPEALTVPAILNTTGNPIFDPEQWVLWSIVVSFPATALAQPLLGYHKIKAQRKMKNGDRIIFQTIGSSANTGQFTSNHTIFLRQ